MNVELKKELPTYEEQQDFYIKLRSKITDYVETKSGKAGKFTPYLLFAPDLFHLLVKSMFDDRIDAKSKTLVGSGILYFITPVDILPEGLIGPGGFIDDIIVATFVVNMLLNKFSPEMIEEHWAGDDKLLNVLKKVSETSDSLLGKLPTRSLLSRFIKTSKKGTAVKS
ncbi:YkvA family protein [Psychrobacillus psychrotolerans]|uniref:YkvA family protein n=1 Tax=Psychrobacillus psychrotolerans TaxID=126156 RepID=UPI0033155306